MKRMKILYVAAAVVLLGATVFSTACKDEKTYGEVGKEIEFVDSDVTLCENGTSAYKVVVPADATVSVNWAANELVTYIERSTGVRLPIVSDVTVTAFNTAEKYISLGGTELFANSGVTVSETELTTDGYKIVRMDNTVFINGVTDWGTSFGVMEFLHHEIGYEPYTADEIYYETKDVVYVKDFGTYVDVPAFEGRAMDGIANYDANTAYRNRIVSFYGSGEDRYGGNKKSHWIPGPDHTITMILPESEYDFYNPSTQICFSNEVVLTAMTENLCKMITENPDGYIVNVGQEDGKGFCECETCRGEIVKYTTSGYFMRFMNKLIENIEAWKAENCPDRRIIYCTFAYGGTASPPVEENAKGGYDIIDESCRPHEKLYIKITQSHCVMHTIDNPNCETNARVIKYFYGWNAICDRLMVWDYAANYSNYLPFHNDIDTIQSSYALYQKLGVINVFTEMNSGGSITSFGFLREYLRGKCLWNPDRDIEKLIDNFFKNYYKDAAGIMREVFELYRSHHKAMDAKSGLHFTPLTTLNATVYWPRNVVDRAEKLIREALKICDEMEDQNAAGKLRPRIEEELVCVELLKVLFYSDYGYDMNAYKDFVLYFEQKTIDMNISKYREHESMASFLAGKKNW